MKQLLLHGLAISSSRKKLSEIKSKFDSANITTFDKGTNMVEIMDNSRTISIFDGERLVIIENISDENIQKLLTIKNDLLTILLWFDKEVDIKKYPGFQAFFFPETKEISVFPLLRLLGIRSPEAFWELEKLKKAGFETQYFITMILYLMRNLVTTPKKAADFVRSNNEKMRKNFSLEELINLYKELLVLDFKIKKGLLEPVQADFLLISKFLRN